VPIKGVMDLIEEEDTIGEFKTAAKSMDLQSLINNLQLTVYAYAYKQLFKTEAKTLKIINFIKNKSPKMETLETTRGQKDLSGSFSWPGKCSPASGPTSLSRALALCALIANTGLIAGTGRGINFPKPQEAVK